MASEREVHVHLLPDLVSPDRLIGKLAVVIDVLRATTTMVHALANGCVQIRPVALVEEALALKEHLASDKVILGGERGGIPLPGFDLGNSPAEYTARRCKGKLLVMTTTNGTRALLRATQAERVLIGSFVNFSAVCEQLKRDLRPLHVICAGSEGEVTMEDTLLAGGLIEYLSEEQDIAPNDGARLAWDCFENHGAMLLGALKLSQGGRHLIDLGMQDDIRLAAEVDRFHIVPELRHDPLRIEIGAVGITSNHWPV